MPLTGHWCRQKGQPARITPVHQKKSPLYTRARADSAIFTQRAKLSGAVYCNRSCMWVFCVCVCVCRSVTTKLEIACIDSHDDVGKGSDHLQLIKFWPSCAPGRGSAARRKFLAPPYYRQRAVFASL